MSVIRYPGVLRAGTMSEQVMNFLDIFPTLAAAAGVEVLSVRPLDGLDLWQAIREGDAVVRSDDIIYTSEGFFGGDSSLLVCCAIGLSWCKR